MAFEKLLFFSKFIPLAIRFGFTLLYRQLQAIRHRWTYRAVDSSVVRNVVVLGGSFSGVHLARRLADSLPTGYRVVLIEKNSHFNYTFNFPRYSVLQGQERLAFIPYSGIAKSAPQGVFEHMQDVAVQLTENELVLKSGNKISFDYLAIATGATQALPAKVTAVERTDACAELRGLQEQIKAAQKIAIIGGGAVGVQISGDIKSIYPEKDVTLIHSCSQLLPNFGNKLHEYVVKAMTELGVELILDERPKLPSTREHSTITTSLELKGGKVVGFDLVIPCTGQYPNSEILAQFAPKLVSQETGRVLVKPTLQLSDIDDEASTNNKSHIFALGDVAETGGPKMARAGGMQAEIVRFNIVSLIRNKDGGTPNLKSYISISIEGALKLSLGMENNVVYVKHNGSEIIMPGKNRSKDLEVKHAWWMFGADMKNA